MVGPPSDVKPSGCGFFLFRAPWHKGRVDMEWLLRDGPVYLVVGGIVFCIVMVAIQSKKEEGKNDPKRKL